MPTISSRQQEELLEESPAFAALPVDQLRVSGKPNAIVRPLRRNREVIEGQYLLNLQPDFKLLQDLETQIIHSNGNGTTNINNKVLKSDSNNNTTATTTILPQTNGPNPAKKTDHGKHNEFTKELDAKLRRLQNDASSKRSSKNGSSQEVDARRKPLFITTVPKGVFLQPTRELPSLAPSAATLRRLYAYESRPRLLITKNNNESSKENLSNNNNDINHPNRNHLSNENGDHNHKITITQTSSEPNVAKVAVFATDSVPRHSCINRTPREHSSYQNVMHDRRVVRGSNFTGFQSWNPYFAYAGLLSGKGEGDCLQKEAEAKRRQLIRKKYVSRNQRGIIGTPPPVRGRRHELVQTEKYLEELFVGHPPVEEAGCQTDQFLYRPPTPPYVPQKVGSDVATQILEGDLFDFDTEVQPIIEVLVGRTIEQALVEVLHEEEIAEIKRQQQQILALREAELSELRRLEIEDQKIQAERERRILQDKIAQDLDREMQERITAAKLLQGRIDDLLPDVMNVVENIKDEKDRVEFERQIAPWIAKQVAHEIGQMIDSKDLLEDIIREVLIQKKHQLLGGPASTLFPEGAVDSEADPVASAEQQRTDADGDGTGEIETSDVSQTREGDEEASTEYCEGHSTSIVETEDNA
ncbi:radial spoke head protein 3 homolog A isoform X2 [Uranotaenia lowii]|uniref:radial spoke head protein 3 homolog A isoform X2 n=1 Tax=Uranotaenia lowii TaxID=190385 RepID=UPI00247A1537|nr:radial spoke head protein 3 homolog A isoform X2 [Uranotaenia lowii]